MSAYLSLKTTAHTDLTRKVIVMYRLTLPLETNSRGYRSDSAMTTVAYIKRTWDRVLSNGRYTRTCPRARVSWQKVEMFVPNLGRNGRVWQTSSRYCSAECGVALSSGISADVSPRSSSLELRSLSSGADQLVGLQFRTKREGRCLFWNACVCSLPQYMNNYVLPSCPPTCSAIYLRGSHCRKDRVEQSCPYKILFMFMLGRPHLLIGRYTETWFHSWYSQAIKISRNINLIITHFFYIWYYYDCYCNIKAISRSKIKKNTSVNNRDEGTAICDVFHPRNPSH